MSKECGYTVKNIDGFKIKITNQEVVKFFELLENKCKLYNINLIDKVYDVIVGIDIDNRCNVYDISFGTIGYVPIHIEYDEYTNLWRIINISSNDLFDKLNYTDIVRLLIFSQFK